MKGRPNLPGGRLLPRKWDRCLYTIPNREMVTKETKDKSRATYMFTSIILPSLSSSTPNSKLKTVSRVLVWLAMQCGARAFL